MKPFYVYILLCNDQSYYVGHTDDIDKRIAEHNLAESSCYTKDKLPVTTVFVESFGTRDEALTMEQQIKKWSRKKKEALIAGDWSKISQYAKKDFKRNKK